MDTLTQLLRERKDVRDKLSIGEKTLEAQYAFMSNLEWDLSKIEAELDKAQA